MTTPSLDPVLQAAVDAGLITQAQAETLPPEVVTAITEGQITVQDSVQIPADQLTEIDAGWLVFDPIHGLQPYSPKDEDGNWVRTQGQDEGLVPFPYGATPPA